jgi:hypothetical protein
MEDKVKFVVITYSCRQFMVQRPFQEGSSSTCLCYGVKQTATPHKSSSAINFNKIERPKLI